MTYKQMKAEVLGKGYDIDGAWGNQCWDFVCYVFQHYYGGFAISCTTTGFVKDIANNKAANGILSFMDDIPLTEELKAGDVCVWGNCTAAPDSHIAIFDHDEGQNKAYFLGQNQPYSYVNIAMIDVTGIIGVFRPKALAATGNTAPTNADDSNVPEGFTPENGTFVLTVDAINVRAEPNTSAEIVAQYLKGQSVVYDCFKAEQSGYVWISYIGASGNRRYMATGKSENFTNTNPWGKFY